MIQTIFSKRKKTNEEIYESNIRSDFSTMKTYIKSITRLNAELAKTWKPIIEKKEAPADADEWRTVKDKLHLLEHD